jgi:predicted glycogen debranching enzyme
MTSIAATRDLFEAATRPALRKLSVRDLDVAARPEALTREWLVTNGLGGYAAGTVGGAPTRRYHGLLVAALPAPYGRRMLLTDLEAEAVLSDGRLVSLMEPDGGLLTEFHLDTGLPVWRFEHERFTLEKRVLLPYLQNTVHVTFRLVDGDERLPLRLGLVVHNRSHDAPVNTPLPMPFVLERAKLGHELSVRDLPCLRLALLGSAAPFIDERRNLAQRVYAIEQSRGYETHGVPWTVGYFKAEVTRTQPVTLIASTEPWEIVAALQPEDALRAELERRSRKVAAAVPAAQHDLGAELVIAADQFIVKPVARARDTARLEATGDEGRTVIAGYHWFTDWGRDTMISLEGLTLVTGREADAAHILRTFAHSLRSGLLPNLFPEGEHQGVYHTADATLWMFHALDRYLERTNDRALLDALLPRLVEIAEQHLRGTRFGIGVDAADGLLRQGAEGYQLTWMDAKVGDWVVTPRRGKAVEINALWYNALRLLERWLRDNSLVAEADRWRAQSVRTRESFNRRFWNPRTQHLYDVVDGESGDDSSCRPNQVFAISLPNAVLDETRWQPVLAAVREKLLTPFGLRTLAPGEPNYQSRYDGDIFSRDAAYHQGTVWAWLIGAFVDAWLRAYPGDTKTARGFLDAFSGHLSDACFGTISEIFDADPPYAPRGCVAQAWSVAEVLRSWVKVRTLT